MGPRFNGVEDGPQHAVSGLELNASMGPRFNGVEDKPPGSRSMLSRRRFNGATL